MTQVRLLHAGIWVGVLLSSEQHVAGAGFIFIEALKVASALQNTDSYVTCCRAGFTATLADSTEAAESAAGGCMQRR